MRTIAIATVVCLAAPGSLRARAAGHAAGHSAGPEATRSTLDRVVAVVGEEIILLSRLHSAANRSPLLAEALSTLPASTPEEVVEARRREVEARVLDGLINLALVKAEAQRFELEASKEDVDRALPNVAAQYGITVEELRAQVVASDEYGSWAEYRADLRDQIIQYKVTQYLATWSVSDAQVREYYRKMTRDESAKVDVRQFVFASDSADREQRDRAFARAQGAVRRLRAGEEPADVAAAVGYDAPLERLVSRGEVAPTLEDAVFAAKAGAVVGPLASGQGYFVFKVVAHQASAALSFEAAKDRIRAQLEQEAMIKAEAELKRQLRAKAHVDIRL